MEKKVQINARIAALRAEMKKRGIDIYLVPTDDFHFSEYVGEYFKCRQFVTGFTGSAGTAVITADKAGLWTDGRYFLQAGAQLEGTEVKLYKMGEPDVLTVHEFIQREMPQNGCLGFDGRCVGIREARLFEKELAEKGAVLCFDEDLVGEIWTDRPELSAEPAMELEVCWAGVSRVDKMKQVRAILEEKKADYLLLSTLDDIAWLLNIRGNDIRCNPVVLSYLILTKEEAFLFANSKVFPAEVKEALKQDRVEILDYFSVCEALGSLKDKKTIWIDPAKSSCRLAKSIPEGLHVLEAENPTVLLKAIKNPVEVENERKAHIRDGVAVTRFLYWLKNTIGKEEITELSAAEKLYSFRQQQKYFMGDSFAPIVSYGEHAAIVHYSATEETDIPLQKKGLLLLDTGGQYLEGTTDITRTVVLGETTDREKEYFTAVLQGHLNLMNARFRYGCTGLNLDYLAREPLWRRGVDYNHGTGHGVGYFLNVHEAPNGFRWRQVAERSDSAVLEEGMITSCEPGYYEDNAFGIRHENLIVCVKDQKNGPLQFLHFEPLTMVPFDKEGLIPEQMSAEQRQWLNEYHELVYETISGHLPEKEREWLREATAAI